MNMDVLFDTCMKLQGLAMNTLLGDVGGCNSNVSIVQQTHANVALHLVLSNQKNELLKNIAFLESKLSSSTSSKIPDFLMLLAKFTLKQRGKLISGQMANQDSIEQLY